MADAQTDAPTRRKPLRLWPGVVIVILQWLARFVVPRVEPEAMQLGVLGGLAGGVAIVVWWLFFSRAPWVDRLGGVAVMAVALYATPFLLHESIVTGAMGMLFFLLAVPVLSLAFVVWAVATRRFSDGARRATMVATILLACGGWALLRTGGFTGDLDNDLAWRWAPTPEERLLAEAGDGAAALPAAPEEAATGRGTPGWPGFRGPGRDGTVPGVRIETDWDASPPVELWRRPVGPGWSSFAVGGGFLYTQEQRGEEEVVACYDASTGEPVWGHRDPARFWESNAGAGPRATPTLHDGRVITLGATGIVNVLDAADGSVVWSRDAAADTDTEVPYWGFSSSPLVVGDVVVVAVAGQLAGYDLATGAPRWFGPEGGVSYSSPHLVTIGGVRQAMLLSEAGAVGVAPADGTVLWEHPWKGYPIVQPARTAGGDLLIAASQDSGTRRLAVARIGDDWSVEERWTSNRLKPYFNDFVVHEGHASGFDNRILACIDLEDGERKWKGGRYGNGQLVLLPDQDLLLVLSEKGELALVGATPDRYAELATFPALEGKTWNHPVLVDDLLLVRNSQEMAAFQLTLADGRGSTPGRSTGR